MNTNDRRILELLKLANRGVRRDAIVTSALLLLGIGEDRVIASLNCLQRQQYIARRKNIYSAIIGPPESIL